MKLINLKVCHDHKSNEEIHHPANKILEVLILSVMLLNYWYLFADHKKLSKRLCLRIRISEWFIEDKVMISNVIAFLVNHHSPIYLYYQSALYSILKLFSIEGEKAMLSIENTKTVNFCLAYACNTENADDRGQWDVQVSLSPLFRHFNIVLQ